jgi:L-fuconolactonase
MSTEPSRTPRIDAHHHLWDLAVRDQEWTRELPTLHRSFTLDDLRPHLARHGVTGTVVVQTVALADETTELLELARASPEVVGVVGWVDLTAPDVADRIARLRQSPGGELLVGLRHLVQSEPDPDWLMRADVRRGLEAVAEAGLVFDLLVRQHQLAAAVAVVEAVPRGRWVLDHAGKPVVHPGAFGEWRRHVDVLAGHPGVACKLSGLVTEVGPAQPVADVRPWARHVLEVFGPERTMVGSDWPVCLLRSSYGEVVALADELLAELSPEERDLAWGGTAGRAYGL